MRKFLTVSAAATLALALAGCEKPAEDTAEPAAAEAAPATAEPATTETAPAATGDAAVAPAAGDAAATAKGEDKAEGEDQQSSGGVQP